MKVYQIARKVDGFGNDVCAFIDEVYEDKYMAKDRARQIINRDYIDNLKAMKEDIEERIDKAIHGIRISYTSDEFNLNWNSLYEEIVTSYDEAQKVPYGDLFIIELNVKEVSD